jgi:hypothetical protein
MPRRGQNHGTLGQTALLGEWRCPREPFYGPTVESALVAGTTRQPEMRDIRIFKFGDPSEICFVTDMLEILYMQLPKRAGNDDGSIPLQNKPLGILG